MVAGRRTATVSLAASARVPVAGASAGPDLGSLVVLRCVGMVRRLVRGRARRALAAREPVARILVRRALARADPLLQSPPGDLRAVRHRRRAPDPAYAQHS